LQGAFTGAFVISGFRIKPGEQQMQSNRYHHLTWLNGIELFEADFHDQTFGRHSHEGFAIGAISAGVGGYQCRGETMVLPHGSLSLMNPEEAHTGHSNAGRLRYKMLYANEEAVRALLDLSQLKGFREVNPQDRGLELTWALETLARRLNAPEGEAGRRLGIEEAVQAVLTTVFETHGGAERRPAGRESAAITVIKHAIETGLVDGAADLSLGGLARLVELHPNYLVRSFSQALGLSPHAYALQCRVGRAKAALVAGMSGAEAAQEAGFCDQSHMIRQFRRHLGVTPSALRAH
jgi:AraC-like DNA-binding protein